MQPITETYIDKSNWYRGPWDDEPDRVEWRSDGTPRLPCLIVRGPSGALCGYVGVPPGHPLHGLGSSDSSPVLSALLEERKGQPMGETPGMGVMIGLLAGELKPRLDVALNVHGGVTYTGKCAGKICHEPRTGESPDVWWIGFDCAHCNDYSDANSRKYEADPDPRTRALLARPPGHDSGATYRSVDYVRREVEKLAAQLQRVAKGE